jgi:nicotinamide mononucleotide transporter
MEIWFQQNWMQLAGTFFALVYLYFSIRENIWLWPVGFLASSFYLIVFFQSRLYADMSLQFYYIVVSVYGWFHWMGRRKNLHKVVTDIPTVSISQKQWLLLSTLVTLLTILIYYLLLTLPEMLDLPESDLPLGDAFTTAASIVGTWMLARKMLENWLVWIVVDAFSIVMYFYKGLYVTVFLFFVYTIMAVVGYYRWKKNMLPKHLHKQ